MVTKPTPDEARKVPNVIHVFGETDGTWSAYVAGEEAAVTARIVPNA